MDRVGELGHRDTFEDQDDGRGRSPGGSASLGRGREEAGKREVDLYIRTYTTLLQSSGAIGVSSLEPAHLTASSSLHAGAAER
ncbi:MAG: hypothetical protein ACR2J8_12675, partial [Thermomicrobiales bacterium]